MRLAAKDREEVFVVRFWLVGPQDADEQWRGCVDHLPTGERRFFAELAELNAFVDRFLNRP